MRKVLFLIVTIMLIGCSSSKVYSSKIFPSSSEKWRPVNPEYFDKNEAMRLLEGSVYYVPTISNNQDTPKQIKKNRK